MEINEGLWYTLVGKIRNLGNLQMIASIVSKNRIDYSKLQKR